MALKDVPLSLLLTRCMDIHGGKTPIHMKSNKKRKLM